MKMSIFLLPASYTAVIHAFLECLGLLFALYVGLVSHSDVLLVTHCGPDHYEFWPSISTTIGDVQPERQIWRGALLFSIFFRFCCLISIFFVFWSKGSRGFQGLKRASSERLSSFLFNSSILSLLMLFCDVTRFLAAFVWTLVASSERLDMHNAGFIIFIVLSELFHISSTVLTWRNRRNAAIYEEPWHGAFSFKSKCVFIAGQTVSFILMGVCYSIHRATCWNGSYSITSIFEWSFALFNLLFDATLWFELRYEGWAFGDWSLFWSSRHFSGSKNALAANLLSPRALDGSDSKSVSILEKREVTLAGTESLSSKSSDAYDVHVLTILSCPSDAVMWACDIFWAYQYFGSLIHSFQHFYFQPMVDMEFTKEVLALFSFFSPVLLMVPVFRRFLTGGIPGTHRFVSWSKSSTSTIPMYVLFYCIVALSHLQQLVSKNSNSKMLAIGVAPFFLSLALVIRFLYPNSVRSDSAEVQECRRLCYAFPLGLVFEMMFRILYISQDPLYINPFYGSIFGIGGGLFFTLVLYRHALFHEQQEMKEENIAFPFFDTSSDSSQNSFFSLVKSYRGISPFWLGVLNGSLIAFALLFLINPGVIPRYFAIDPFPAGVLVVLLFLFGLMCSPYLLPITSSEGPVAHKFFSVRFLKNHKAVPAVFCMLCFLFTVLMLYGTRQSNFAYSSHRYTYGEPNVSISDWKTQENFSGSKYFSFCCGLSMIFCVGVLFPVAMEITWVQRRYRSDLFSKGKNVSQLPNGSKFSFGNFELVSNTVLLFFLITFVMCLCYPFMPLGELFREGTRRMILILVTTILFTVFVSVTRTRRVNREAFPNQNMIPQRRLPMGVVITVFLTLFFVLYGRIVLQPDITGFPVGDSEFAATYQPYILCMQDKLMEVTTARNRLTDDAQSSPWWAYNKAYSQNMMYTLQRTLVSKGCLSYQSKALLPLSEELNRKVLDVAEALYQFSGLIWTIHFALDNYNADSLPNMVKAIESTRASVIGILESDLSHIQNGNRDVAEFLSYYLGFPYVDNGPVPLDGTFGCALISRYPILKVRRYILPSPLGELSCLIHATIDVMGIHVETYVGHFGNTQHDADGLLQSQFLGQLVKNTPGPSMWLGYLVTFPGNPLKYAQYSDPIKPGYLRDAGQWLYTKKAWVRLQERGGYDEIPPPPGRKIPEEEFNEFNVEAKIEGAAYLEEDLDHVDESFRATPPGKKRRTFYFNETNRYTHYHPRYEFLDRYCEYCMFKTGLKEDEKEEHWGNLQPYALQLYDWMRVADNPFIDSLSDTEIQVIKLKFVPQQE